MRQQRTVQASLFDLFAGHEIGRELKAMSQWLQTRIRERIGLVAEDLRRHGVKPRPGDKVCRQSRCCAVGFLQAHRQLSYEELAFHLEDLRLVPGSSPGCRLSWTPKKSFGAAP